MTELLVDDGGGIRSLPHRWAKGSGINAEYFHLARSASMHGYGLAVRALCGVHLLSPILTDEPEGGPVCGTCVGRRVGIDVDGIAYRPRTVRWLPKTWCPGSRKRWVVDVTRDLARCLACGQLVGWHGDSVRAHFHDGRGVACPEHGSRGLHSTNPYGLREHGPNVLRCWIGNCRRTPRPFWLIPSHEGGSIR